MINANNIHLKNDILGRNMKIIIKILLAIMSEHKKQSILMERQIRSIEDLTGATEDLERIIRNRL